MRFNNTRNLRFQKGLTLVELGLAVGIGLFLIIIAITPAKQMFSSAMSSGELKEFPQIVFNVQKIYKTKSTFAGATVDNLARLNAFPSDKTTIPASGSATVTNRWGGNVTVTPANLTATNDILRITYPSVPQGECVEVVQGVAGVTRRVYVDGTNAGTTGGGTIVKADGANLDTDALGNQCKNLNTITFDIGK